MGKKGKVVLSVVMSGALILSGTGIQADAKAKSSVSLNKTKISLKRGKKYTLKIKKRGVKKIRSIRYTTSKKKVATVSKKGVIRAKASGRAVIKVKVKYIPKGKKKAVTKTLKCKVTVPSAKKKTTANKSAVTQTPAQTPAQTPKKTASPAESPTPTPAVYGKPGEVAAYNTAKSNYTLNVDASNKVHSISDMLYGIFIEDINFAADGGLYAEMVQNRSFEFTSLAAGNEKHAWSDVGTVTAQVKKNDTSGYLNANNPNYMVVTNTSSSDAGIANKGFLDGMSIVSGNKYKFSVYAKGLDGYTGPVRVSLVNGSTVAAQGTIAAVTDQWQKLHPMSQPIKM